MVVTGDPESIFPLSEYTSSLKSPVGTTSSNSMLAKNVFSIEGLDGADFAAAGSGRTSYVSCVRLAT